MGRHRPDSEDGSPPGFEVLGDGPLIPGATLLRLPPSGRGAT
jgi:hypothetical protein